jgi:hypothetical protein
LLDVGTTLYGQTPEYWSGSFEAARELNPVFRAVLRLGPGWFVAIATFQMLLFGTIMMLLPPAVSVPIILVATILHAVGSAGWIADSGMPGILAAVLLLVIVRFSWDRLSMKDARGRRQAP